MFEQLLRRLASLGIPGNARAEEIQEVECFALQTGLNEHLDHRRFAAVRAPALKFRRASDVRDVAAKKASFGKKMPSVEPLVLLEPRR